MYITARLKVSKTDATDPETAETDSLTKKAVPKASPVKKLLSYLNGSVTNFENAKLRLFIVFPKFPKIPIEETILRNCL